ncbi:S1C family serine protease [Agromyces kandeliae]|uniref:PDZ domain-containing protein n=1 Tax=Agromyces kandeliae TaxID=2666141 RepID=A0A6L5R5L2_9MICO|nr:trypsin-like peptidase domain-containing protein [Agromyces kandeliae]MRX45376.1 PDZ domain-containing protein [Agromyces kandeliae]
MTETNTGGIEQTPEPHPTPTAEGADAAEAPAQVETPRADAPAEPVSEPPAPAPATEATVEPAAPAAPAAAPAAASTPAETPAPAAHPAPAAAPATPVAEPAPRPTGTVYAPGQAPQPYIAGQYRHDPAAPTAGQTQPTAPVAGAPAASAASGAHRADGAGTVPPAFGGAPTAVQEPAPKQRRVGFGVAAAIVAAALIGGASGAGITALMTDDGDSAVEQTSSGTQRIVVNDDGSVNRVAAVAAAASPSVVTIEVSGGQSGGTGSGIILSEDGYVLTNTHVVTLDGATGDPSIQVKADDGSLYSAELIGTDPLSDLAVIKLADASGLTPIEFADSSELNVGDTAIAIGAPLGLSGTVTNGIVSALNRSIDVESSAAPETTPDSGEGDQGGSGDSPFDFWNFDGQEGNGSSGGGGLISIPVIQTDAAINPGNSGGALLDSEGKLIGVNVAILSAGGSSSEAGNIGVGFAVPSNLAERIAGEIIENGSATHGLLGATVTSAQASGESSTVGALIAEVSAGGAAEAAGLQSGDVVTALNGIPITDQTDLTAQVRALAGGAEAEVTYTRDGESNTVTVTLGTFEG